MHLIENSENEQEDSGSSHEMMIFDTGLVSNDCYLEGRHKRLDFRDQSRLVPAFEEQVMSMSCTRLCSRTIFTNFESSWNWNSTVNSDYSLSMADKYMLSRTPAEPQSKDSAIFSDTPETLVEFWRSVPEIYVSES